MKAFGHNAVSMVPWSKTAADILLHLDHPPHRGYIPGPYLCREIRLSRTAKLFWSGRSQAVRLPKEFRMKGAEVRIRRQGAAVILEPVATDWTWLDSIAGEFSDDFFAAGRSQPGLPQRTGLDSVFD